MQVDPCDFRSTLAHYTSNYNFSPGFSTKLLFFSYLNALVRNSWCPTYLTNHRNKNQYTNFHIFDYSPMFCDYRYMIFFSFLPQTFLDLIAGPGSMLSLSKFMVSYKI